jgi:DNA repair protein RecN (Recombination protein N)
MLLELRAENYAVIDQAVASFGPGLNLLTGETGAGKSILIDALALLLGGKASSDVVRHGAEKAVLGCVFQSTPGAAAILDANGIDAGAGYGSGSGSDDILLRREIAAGGKGRVFINNQPATVAVLRELAPELGLIHSQGETLGSFDQAQQRVLLDRFGDLSTEDVAATYAAWRATSERLAELQASEQDRLRMADLWRFQAQEIADAQLTAEDEDQQLETEKRVLANAEKLYAAAMSAHELLYEQEGSAEATLGLALKQVEELARYEPRFAEAAQQLASAKATVEDVSAEVRDFAEKAQASPERLEEIEDRLAALDRLKRKYGGAAASQTLAEVMRFGEEAARKLAEVENRDALLAELRVQLEHDAAAYRRVAEELSAARAAAAGRLEKLATAQINDLAMSVRFKVVVAGTGEVEKGEKQIPFGNDNKGNDSKGNDSKTWTATGWDAVQYLIATNAGEPLKPLEEIASGGEMSRVMLALKVTVEESFAAGASKGKKKAAGQALPTPRMLVFDEIDIGIGGRAAEAVGRKLKTLSKRQQVVCITHLPQIAAFADQHFVIEKADKGGRTRTSIRRMEEGEREREVARMLSGAKLTDTSLEHARQLLEASR